MSFTAPKFTNAGKQLLSRVLGGDCDLKFTSIAVGFGEMTTQAIASMTALINEKKRCEIIELRRTGNEYVIIKAEFTNQELTEGFFWREIGLFAQNPDFPEDRTKDILYCYQNSGDLAEYIPSVGSEIIDKIISMSITISDAANVTAIFSSDIFVQKEFFDDHVNDKNNPHEVTVAKIGAVPEEHLTDENAHDYIYTPATFYVAKTGNDTTGDGTEENPFLTIQHAFDSASTYALSVTVLISTGAYAEDVTATNKQWRYLSIKPKATNQTVSIKSAYFTRINFISLNNLEFTGKIAALNDAVRIDYCQAYISACKFTAPDADSFGVYAYGARTKIFDSVFAGWKTAIFCNNGILESYGNTGSGCVTAYGTSGGIISVSTTDNIVATTPRTAIQGGAIIDETTGKAITAGKLAQTHVDNNFSNVQKQAGKFSVLSIGGVEADATGNVNVTTSTITYHDGVI